MLKRFNVKNFLSFSCREDGLSQEFSMIPGKVQRKREHIFDDGTNKLLKFAAVYGANASGKSNFVKALRCMQHIVEKGTAKDYTEKYCRMDAANKDEPSYFEVEIILDGKCYAYGFEVILSKAKFVSEWLVELHPNGSETMIFERDIPAKECKFCSWKTKELIKKTDVYAWDIAENNNVLLLSEMNDNKEKLYDKYKEIRILNRVYGWFKYVLNITFPNTSVSGYRYLSDKSKMEDIKGEISKFGTGIIDISIIKYTREELYKLLSEKDKNKVDAVLTAVDVAVRNEVDITITVRAKEGLFVISVNENGDVDIEFLRFVHSGNTVFQLSEESDGTIRLLDLLEVLLSDGNKTFVIDELDRCLHPNLTYHFIETFLRYAEKKNIQLIVTTHESRLLDLDLLRRDEVWFANKRDTGESDLYSLEEFNERYDRKIDKAYLEGRYRGVPVFDSIFPVCGEDS